MFPDPPSPPARTIVQPICVICRYNCAKDSKGVKFGTDETNTI